MTSDGLDTVLAGYHATAPALIPRFEALSCAQIYAPVHHLFPKTSARVLDIGAGTGRDAAWLANFGHSVVAVEPVNPFRLYGKGRHGRTEITWVDDRLPGLATLESHAQGFDFILISGVWHHLMPDTRPEALTTLARLLAPTGHIVLSLRHGPCPGDRPAFAIAENETEDSATACGLRCVFRVQTASLQQANIAAGVTWTWLAFAKGHDRPG